MIAALYVERGGVYDGLPGVDLWDKVRDARLYAGPWPAVAHPPCERWGKYWFGSPAMAGRGVRLKKGDDAGCFAAAIAAVRKFGGVLEHPEGSAAWAAFGLAMPVKSGGWHAAGDFIGWTCSVEQGHYGHPAHKPTWLYAAGIPELPSLLWGRSSVRGRIEESFRTAASARAQRSRPDYRPVKRISPYERIATPIPFRDVLIDMAKSARRPA